MTTDRSISIVIATHHRKSVALGTLQRLHALRSDAPLEIIVVDNASPDGTAAAIRHRFPQTQLVALPENLGSCAKAFGVERARGAFVVFLDDDSYPRAGCLERMLARFTEDVRLGAAGFRVFLPDGREEGSALPNVFVGCGVGFRREALAEVGGLDRALFMQAEEYDLSFRLIHAGWKVETFAELAVDHLKTPRARLSGRTVYHDTRNNLLLAARYLPDPQQTVYRRDWADRYGWLAARAGHRAAYWRGRLAAARRWRSARRAYAGRRLDASAFEQLFRHGEIGARFDALREAGVRRVLLGTLGKNLWPFVHHARRVGIEPVAIADDDFVGSTRHYRGVPVLATDEALRCDFDRVVVSDTSPVHAARTATRLTGMTRAPIQAWFQFLPTQFAEGGRDTGFPASSAPPAACVTGA